MLRLLAVVLLASTLAGCIVGRNHNSAELTTRFTGSEQDAIVVIGVNSTFMRQGTIVREYYSPFTLTWGRLKARGAPDDPKGAFTVSFPSTSVTAGKTTDDYAHHGVFRLSPGTYVLQDATYQENNTTYRTVFTAQVGMPSFVVRAGEVAYVGDFEFTVVTNPQLKSIVRREDRAKAALQKFAGITASMVDRRPTLYKRADITIPAEGPK